MERRTPVRRQAWRRHLTRRRATGSAAVRPQLAGAGARRRRRPRPRPPLRPDQRLRQQRAGLRAAAPGHQWLLRPVRRRAGRRRPPFARRGRRGVVTRRRRGRDRRGVRGRLMDGADRLTLRVVDRLAKVPAAAWDACAGSHPFVAHAFLNALEESGSATGDTGWLPQHLLLEDAGGKLIGAAPLYVKSHSYGEYVFDHGWAEAYERAGGRY